ncbi:MAG: hypothetical protein JWM53_4477 [bacterium]|nr:hypothetical protein [bacterium]
MHVSSSLRALAVCALFAPFATGCDTPNTDVIADNGYPPSTTQALVVYRAFWQAVAFRTPIPPGSSSDPQTTVAASPNTAYVVLAPGWDPTADAAPMSFVVLQSRQGFEVHWTTTLHIPIDDTTFAGNCAAGSVLTREQADFITERVFADVFAGRHYDAATCTTTGAP